MPNKSLIRDILAVFTAAVIFLNNPAFAALPQALGGSGFGIAAKKANLEGEYPTYWDNLMQQQSYSDMRRGLIELAASKYDDAAQSFAKAVVKNPKEAYPHVFLGVALYWQGKVDQAMGEYREAIKLSPDNAEAHQLMGIAYAWKGNVEQALEYFKKASDLAPNRSDIHMNLGSTYAALNDLDDALFHFRKAVELDSRSALYQYQLAALLEVLGRDSQAEAALKKSLRLYPNYEEAMLALAVLYEKTGRTTAAELYYKKALKIKPGDGAARIRLANLLAKLGRMDEAMQILSPAFIISPLSGEGLALSLAYSDGNDSYGERSNQPSQNNPSAKPSAKDDAKDSQEPADAKDNNSQPIAGLEQFKKKLLKVPYDKQLNIDAEVLFKPKVEPSKIDVAQPVEAGAKPKISRFETAVEQKKAEENTFSRSFILMPGSPEAREKQLEQIFQSMESLLREAGRNYDINMSLRGSVPVKDSTVLGGGNSSGGPSSGGKAGYNPYMVGNDMGLWVTGKGWIKYVQEIMPEVEARVNQNTNEGNYIIYALGNMMLGRGGEALEVYSKAAASGNKNIQQLARLGMGTAYVMLGDEQAALKEYKEILEINKDNDIAKKNIAVLEAEEK